MYKRPEAKSTTAEGCMWVDQETSSCLTQRQGGKHGGGRRWRRESEKQAEACGPVQLNNPASCTFQWVSLKVGSPRPSKLPHPPRFLPQTPKRPRPPFLKLESWGRGGLKETVRTRAHHPVSHPRPESSGAEKFQSWKLNYSFPSSRVLDSTLTWSRC